MPVFVLVEIQLQWDPRRATFVPPRHLRANLFAKFGEGDPVLDRPVYGKAIGTVCRSLRHARGNLTPALIRKAC